MDSRIQTTDDAIELATISAAQFRDSSLENIRRARNTGEANRQRITQELITRRGKLDAAEGELRRAIASLNECRRDPEADCGGQESYAHNAKAAVAAASEQVRRAERARQLIESACSAFDSASNSGIRDLDRCRDTAVSMRSRLVGHVRAYAGASGDSSATAGSSSNLGGGSVGVGNAASNDGLEQVGASDVFLVNVGEVDDADSTVNGPEDFRHMDVATAEWACETVDSVIIPSVRQGHGRDYFERRDAAEGRSENRSLARLYDTTFGSNAVTLSASGGGRYEVIGGYHRIWMARRLGVNSIPARVHR